jgi:O-acetyl-ADP-ribose deacetylase (regulator of RNase III)
LYINNKESILSDNNNQNDYINSKIDNKKEENENIEKINEIDSKKEEENENFKIKENKNEDVNLFKKSSTFPLNNNNNNNYFKKEIKKIDQSQSILIKEHKLPTGQVIQVRRGDITKEDVDAIVNAANSHLAHGGGVAGAVLKAGGPIIQKESDKWIKKYGIVKTGEVALTSGGNMLCSYVIHAVGPIWDDGKSREINNLQNAVLNSLQKAHDLQLKSISIPAISSGIFGFPKDLCAKVMFYSIFHFCKEFGEKTSLKEIRLTNFDKITVSVFEKEFNDFLKKI